MITYKAEMLGKTTDYVNPYRTSQLHYICEQLGYRFRDRFFCPHCNSTLDSDYNASCNLRRLIVTKPIVSSDEGKTLTNGLSLSLGIKAPNFS